MAINILFLAPPRDWQNYQAPLDAAFKARGLIVNLVTETDEPASIDYIIFAPTRRPRDFTPYTNTKAVLSLWAGVETIVTNPTLSQPLCRMVDTGLAEGMRDWVVGHVLRYHLGFDRHIMQQNGAWDDTNIAPLSRDRKVGILGLGELGRVCAEALHSLGFDVSGWSRNAKPQTTFSSHHGETGLDHVLARSEILVLLLPLTPSTEGVINPQRLAKLPRGAYLLNPGRGGLINDTAMLSALNSGHIAHATLDVFREEPLPPENPYWAHPHVTVTPHIASATRPGTAAPAIAENVARGEAGHDFLHLVDRKRGY